MFQLINYYFISNLIHTQLVSLQNGTKKNQKSMKAAATKKKYKKLLSRLRLLKVVQMIIIFL